MLGRIPRRRCCYHHHHRVSFLPHCWIPRHPQPWRPLPEELVAAFKACSGAKEADLGRAIQQQAICSGHLVANLYVANTAVDMLASCGSLADARYLFDRLPCHSVVSWNALILGYAQHGPDEAAIALELFQGLTAEPDRRTFMAALKACSVLGNCRDRAFVEVVEIGVATHCRAFAAGYGSSNFVANTLVDMYANFGSMLDARSVFDRIESWDVVSWNALLLGYAENGDEDLALTLFSCMGSIEGAAPNHLTFVAALKACSNLAAKENGRRVDANAVKAAALEKAAELHSLAMELGHDSNAKVAGALVDLYAKCGSMVAARRVFDGFSPLDVALWNILLLGYADNGEADAALEVYETMKSRGFARTSRTFVALLKACTVLAAKEEARLVNGKMVKIFSLEKAAFFHSQASELGCDGDIFLASTLVDLYSKCGSLADAKKVFDAMPRRNEVAWNALMQGYVESKEAEAALALFSAMASSSCAPDALSFVAAAKACTALAAAEECKQQPDGRTLKPISLERGKGIHDRARESGFITNAYVANSLIDMYAKCGSVKDARELLDRVPASDLVSRTALMQGYAESGDGELALEIFRSMNTKDSLALAAALKACGSLAALETGRSIHAEACRLGLGQDSLLPNGVVDFYSKCGSMHAAQQCFDSLRSRDTVNYTAVIAGYSHHGNTSVVFDLFRAMEDEGCEANAVTFVSLLTACSRAGLIRRGREYFRAMQARYGLKQGVEHYVCMVDMLARSNRLQEALTTAAEMPCEPNSVLWTSLLAGCCKWKNVEVARVAFDALVKLDEQQSAAYLLMANVYGSCGLWEERDRVLLLRAAGN